ncbi:MAG TPA: carboxypeptidase-like regulatory domain-containing protein [Terriglobia bacterium]|nr:carboxypeptidase-like regulatory domain-containing protein [Terriglobia bacterium]
MLAQSTAQVTGTIKDQTGAVLPGVEVTVTQSDTGFKRSAVTNETGSYVLPSLPVGPYRLEAVLPGFRTYTQTGIILQVDSNPVINAVLQVGQASDEISVQADAALVETRSTGVGAVMDNVRVVELPLNGRRVSDLILISGAAVQAATGGTGLSFGYGARGYNQTAISVAGGQGAGVEYNLDGGTHAQSREPEQSDDPEHQQFDYRLKQPAIWEYHDRGRSANSAICVEVCVLIHQAV